MMKPVMPYTVKNQPLYGTHVTNTQYYFVFLLRPTIRLSYTLHDDDCRVTERQLILISQFQNEVNYKNNNLSSFSNSQDLC